MITDKSNILIFVDGTLKEGFHNHHLLSSSEFVSTFKTEPLYTFVDLGAYPAVLNKGDTSIHGEIYCINENTLSDLDQLEGYPAYYDRVLIPTILGDAWMYILVQNDNYLIIESGMWL